MKIATIFNLQKKSVFKRKDLNRLNLLAIASNKNSTRLGQIPGHAQLPTSRMSWLDQPAGKKVGDPLNMDAWRINKYSVSFPTRCHKKLADSSRPNFGQGIIKVTKFTTLYGCVLECLRAANH